MFFGVVTGVPRPFREAGIQAPDPAAGRRTIPPVPRFDANPERIRVDSDGLVGAPPIDVATGAVVTGLVGPLDYAFRTYTILPDPRRTSAWRAARRPRPVSAADGMEVHGRVVQPGALLRHRERPRHRRAVLTADGLRDPAEQGVARHPRTSRRLPDILGVVEVENLTTLQALAAKISADAIAAAQPDPLTRPSSSRATTSAASTSASW